MHSVHCINWIFFTKYSTLYKKRQTKIRSRHTLVVELQKSSFTLVEKLSTSFTQKQE